MVVYIHKEVTHLGLHALYKFVINKENRRIKFFIIFIFMIRYLITDKLFCFYVVGNCADKTNVLVGVEFS